MANRSYLYASTALPDAQASPSTLRGISEHAYAVPLLFRLLVSCETRPCRSAIWDEPGPLALAGRCGPGIARAAAFLARIEHPAISPMREEALRFLNERTRPDDWFVLEPAEVLGMGDAPVAEAVEKLRLGLGDLDAEIERTLATPRRGRRTSGNACCRPRSRWSRRRSASSAWATGRIRSTSRSMRPTMAATTPDRPTARHARHPRRQARGRDLLARPVQPRRRERDLRVGRRRGLHEAAARAPRRAGRARYRLLADPQAAALQRRWRAARRGRDPLAQRPGLGHAHLPLQRRGRHQAAARRVHAGPPALRLPARAAPTCSCRSTRRTCARRWPRASRPRACWSNR